MKYTSVSLCLLFLAVSLWVLAGQRDAVAQVSGSANLTLTTTATATLTAAPIPCNPDWSVVPAPHVIDAIGDVLRGVAAVSSGDVWAVGYYDSNAHGSQTLIEHLDGSTWSVVPSPNPGTTSDFLNAIAVAASNDVWAVGYDDSNSRFQTLVEHWDGNVWSVVPSPSVSNFNNQLNGVTALSSNDVWAVGRYYVNRLAYHTLIEHWNGSIWSIEPSPSMGIESNLLDVAAVGSSYVWAVGYYSDEYGTYSLIEYWNGSTWSIIPNPGSGFLVGVAVVSGTDAWAVGSYSLNSVGQTLIEHWDGNTWSVVPSPNVGTLYNGLSEVAVSSGSDVWAVGGYDSNSMTQTLIEHWDGSNWSVVPSPNVSTSTNSLDGVAALANHEVWAVGSYVDDTGNHSLIERYDPCTGSPTPTVTGTPPTSTPTSTLTSTPPATTTATACTITFSDVPSDHTFYPYIRCLACRGVISGYEDGTFRPDNKITRGQIAKMVSNAANINDDPGPQIFEDVESTNAFYLWVNRLSNRGYMSGYPCGGDGEPCNPPLDRPYFRPFANATRGQLSKIVSNTAEVGGTPAGQFYSDVPLNHPFYLWVMRLTELGVMSGYQCGGEGEPCDDQNRPYFRPNSDVTRGQASKILANTFFPDCQTPAKR